mmetsp:Transcript_17659/g.31133  ORF Transcript_17659/g.31133 Transcript_17659/m.31133 type:complete len:243 (+) Transcript_17659:69-797(+)
MNEEEDDTVRLNSEDQRVWLVKVPLRVARKWDEAKADDALLGKLQVHNASDSKDAPKLTFHLPEDDTKASTLATSTDFDLRPQDEMVAPMRVFAKGDGGVEMLGVVEQVFFMQPMQTSTYRRSIERRVKQANQRTRGTQEMDAMLFKQTPRVVKTTEENEQAAKRRKTGAGSGEEGLREAIFTLFARKDETGVRMTHWSLKDIKRELGIAEDGPLRKMLKTLCIFHGDGEYARTYELKADFK